MIRTLSPWLLALACCLAWQTPGATGLAGEKVSPPAPICGPDVVFEEVDGLLVVEAEHFFKQTETGVRAWHITTAAAVPNVSPDGDGPHVKGSSGGAYVEALPDTRRTHGDKLIAGQNFSDEPGKMAILSYNAYFNTPGRYYVWVRALSTGAEDNGLHVGIDGAWPESGRRWQTVDKQQWSWDSKQRTQQNHTGEPYKLYLDVEKAGPHVIMFSMREDGFEFDKWIMTTDRQFAKPSDAGPAPRVKQGKAPPPFEIPASYQEKAPPAEVAGAAPAAPAWQPAAPSGPPLVQPRQADGKGAVKIDGELKQWHKVTLTLDGPFAHERDNEPNPFTDYRMSVQFAHESGAPRYTVPGYFAADGNAAETSAEAGTKWRTHLSPDKPGKWNYTVSLLRGKRAALETEAKAQPVALYHGQSGAFEIGPTDKTGRDFRARGRLEYVGKHHLRFAGSGEYFLKAGPDSPENLLAYVDFDATRSNKRRTPRAGEATPEGLKSFQPHVRDWRAGDPTWKNGKGKGLIGALNYLAGKGCNAFSFMPYNAGGDGDDVWPFVDRNDKLHYDCSKLDQWQIVFDHAQSLGLYLHFKMQETEMDDKVATSLDGGDLGPERKLYCRELIARFGYELALNWNLGEENTQTPEQQRAMAQYITDTSPYRHNIVVHTFPGAQEKVYTPLLGKQSALTGVSLQNGWSQVHQLTLRWITESAHAGRPWVVANDEQNPAGLGVPPDPGYQGHSGEAAEGKGKPYTMHDIRKATLWGNLMAGGAGVEYYFGYKLPQNDLVCEDFRSRDKSWDYCRIALEFFAKNEIPFWDMASADALVGNEKNDNSRYCLAKPGEAYVVYLPAGGTAEIDLAKAQGAFRVQWYNPRQGGALMAGSVAEVAGGKKVSLGTPPADADEDWAVLVRK